MPEPTEITPAMIDQLVIKNRRNNIAACVSMLATFYVSCSFDQETRLAMAELVDEYYAAAKPYLRWATSSSIEGHRQNLRKMPLSLCRERVERMTASHTFAMNLTGSEDTDDANPFMLIALMPLKTPPPFMGFLSVAFPFSFLEQQPPGWYFQWIRSACERLRPLHGYAGFGLATSIDAAEASGALKLMYPYAARFPGLEIDDPVKLLFYLENGIKGVNWLTIVDDSLLERIGGRDEVRESFSDLITVHEYGGGLIVQAGPVPQLGDLETGFVPQRYREAYRVLKPLQAEHPTKLIETPKGVDPLEFKDRWMKRFA
jgi:hypothetical protein